jgi:hypothetical protein
MGPREWRVCVSLDVDLVDHTSGQPRLDELTDAIPRLLELYDRHPAWTATWFLRLDRQIGALYGDAEYVFSGHHALIRELKQRGHSIGWHPHCYTGRNGKWTQNVQVAEIVDELTQCARQARSHDLTMVRMGWGFHTNETMAVLSDAGFGIDSSAIPRPVYPWETSAKDWSTSPPTPFFPSRRDYRVPGNPSWPILEMPVSVAPVASPYDEGPVSRYLNPAFEPAALLPALEWWLARHQTMLMLAHPSEVMPSTVAHPLIAHDLSALEQNLASIERLAAEREITLSFVTLEELSKTQ